LNPDSSGLKAEAPILIQAHKKVKVGQYLGGEAKGGYDVGGD
jgi:hypothetical protein